MGNAFVKSSIGDEGRTVSALSELPSLFVTVSSEPRSRSGATARAPSILIHSFRCARMTAAHPLPHASSVGLTETC